MPLPAEGTWLSQDGGTKVRLSNCGGKLCGTVVWLHEPTDRATGKPKTDKLNPDPAKRARPMIGLQVAARPGARRPEQMVGPASTMPTTATPTRRSFQVQGDSTAKVQGCVLGGAVQEPDLDAQQLTQR